MAAAIAGTTTNTSLLRRHQPLSFSQSNLPFRTPLKPSSKIKSLSTPPAPRIARISSSYYPGEIDIDVDSDKPREECGVVGIIGDPDSARIACLALHALQHRGQEAAGIASSNSGRLHSRTGLGLVSEVFRDPSSFSSLPGHSSIGHVRYSTAGAASSPLNVQPFTAGYRFGHLAVAHNGNIVNYSSQCRRRHPRARLGLLRCAGLRETVRGVQFQQGLIRSHYVTRTFIQPSQELRDLAVKLKLAPVQGILEDKIVVVVDDSIVRGTTSSKIVRLIKNAEVHMRIACPPIVGSCYYGVDTPRTEELISIRMDVEGLRKEIGCDSVRWRLLIFNFVMVF